MVKRIKFRRYRSVTPFNVTLQDLFILDMKKGQKYYKNLIDLNVIKLNDIERGIIESHTGGDSNFIRSGSQRIVNILPEFKNFFENEFRISSYKSDQVLAIEKIISNKDIRSRSSLRRIKLQYEQTTGLNLSTRSISRILKNKLDHHYLKTTLKNHRLRNKKQISNALLLIRSVYKLIQEKLNFVWIDETPLYVSNKHFRTWRKRDDLNFYDSGSKTKLNLLMAVNSEKVINYDIYETNTEEEKYQEFLEKILDLLKEEEKKNVFS